MATAVEGTRERVIEAAGQVFAQKGYENATVREICQLGKANLAAINYHFGDKQRLYIEAVKRAYRHRLDQVPLPQWPAGTSAETKLAGFVLTLLRRMLGQDNSGWESELMLREVASPMGACLEVVTQYIGPQFRVLQGIMTELMPEASPRERHLAAFSIVGQCLHYRVAAPVVQLLVPAEEYETYQPELLAEHITQLTLHGIRAHRARKEE